MKIETALTWSWLQCLTAKRVEALAKVYGNLDRALEAFDVSLLRTLGCTDEGVQRAMQRRENFDVASYAAELQARGITFFTFEDDRYPAQLRAIPDYSLFLYTKGNLSVLAAPLVAIVGTRRMTAYGQAVTGKFVHRLVASGVITVSGLALGIDAEVARVTMEAEGKTVAVLAHGMREIFPPTNAPLARQILVNGGLLLSEYPLDQHPTKFTFPERNRIIAGLTRATLVIEAGEKSGALITAALALDYDREVFAVPGSVLSSASTGCHALIRGNRAQIATTAEDILSSLGIAFPFERSSLPPSNDPVEATLLSVLRDLPQSVSMLVDRTCLPPSLVSIALTKLEIRGAVKHGGDGTWILSC